MSFNPMQIIQAIRSGQNPQQLVMSILEQRMSGTPMGDNLLNLAKDNKTQEIEQIARNICRQKGIDFDKEFNTFKNIIGGK